MVFAYPALKIGYLALLTILSYGLCVIGSWVVWRNWNWTSVWIALICYLAAGYVIIHVLTLALGDENGDLQSHLLRHYPRGTLFAWISGPARHRRKSK